MDYQIRTHSRTRKLTLRLNKTGQPIVTAPRFIPKFLIDRFVTAQTDWITTSQQKLKVSRAKFITPTSISLFGKKYIKQIKITDQASNVKIQKNKVIISLHQSKSTKKTQQVLEKFLKNTATHYLARRTNQLAKKMKLHFKKISLRAQTTRWGSCSSAGNLSFNWRLVHFSPAIIDYVIIHELAHLQHPNHSQQFWSLVAKFDPEHKLHRGWLKRQGIGVG